MKKKESIVVTYKEKNKMFSFVYNNLPRNIDVSFLNKYVWEPINDRSFEAISFLEVVYVLHTIDQILPPRPIDGRRDIFVKIPVENIYSFNLIRIKFQDLLFWMTDDKWEIEFYERSECRDIPIRLPLRFIGNTVALWSGGLDAATGAYLQLYNNPVSKILLVGSGRNSRVFKKQHELATQLKKYFPKRVEYIRIPVKFDGKLKNKYARTRGLIFTTIGLIVSNSIDSNELLVFENGIGALNEAIDSNHFCKMSHSVHPKTLYDISEIYSLFVGKSFKILNPYLFHTKGQMCSEALSKSCSENFLLASDSCDSHGREKGFPHCGVCSSCLLRRVSLIYSIGRDDRHYGQQTKNRKEEINKLEGYTKNNPINKYGSCYVKAYEVSDCKDSFEDRITILYHSYRKEVEVALPQIIYNETMIDKRL